MGFPAWGAWTRKLSPNNIWLWKPVGLIPFESWNGVGKQDLVLEGLVCKLTCSKFQMRGSSLKITWVIQKEASLTNIRAGARGPGICWNFLVTGALVGTIFFFFSFISVSWRLISLQYCSGFCHTLTWISHGFTCVPHPDPPSHHF